jgi:ribosomal protein S21
MAFVVAREGENPEALLSRFRATVQNAGVLKELKERRYFRSKGEKVRAAARKAAKKHARAQRRRNYN